MKKNRILGILWLAFCSYSSFNLLQTLQSLHPHAPEVAQTLQSLHPVDPEYEVARFFLVFSCLIFLAGIVASIFLFRGAIWPRWIVALIAIFVVLGNIGYIVSYRSLPVWAASRCVFAIVSLVLLFLPKHEPVAEHIEN